jgi:perosamine synthetase
MKNLIENKKCSSENTIEEILKVINNTPSGFAFVVDSEQKLTGLVTDGDVRRAILNGFGLNHTFLDINSKMCEFAYHDDDNLEIVKKLSDKIRILPLVDKKMKLIDFIQFDKRNYFPIAQPIFEGNELKYLTDSLLSTWISSTGEYIDRFENDFSSYINTNYGVATSNGTTALHLALLALDIKEGDEVIVPDLTFAATINSVLYSRATPVIVDVEMDSWCIDPKEIKKAISPRTKAIIPVHLYGQACDMKSIMEIAKENNLYVIEDCAEAHGAEFEGQKVGSFGDISCFSFFGNKIITTGEGGMCLTNSSELNKKMRQFRDHGMNTMKKYWHDVVGYNYRMTNMQAAIGCAQFEKISSIIQSRKEIEDKYFRLFSKYNFIQPQEHFSNRKKVTWLVSCILDEKIDKEKFKRIFNEKNFDIRNLFYCLSEMPIYKKYSKNSNPVSKYLSDNGISFPTHNGVDFNQFELVLESFITSLNNES